MFGKSPGTKLSRLFDRVTAVESVTGDIPGLVESEVTSYLIANPPTGGVQLGETSLTAYRGDRGKTAYDHSQTTHAPSGAEANVQPDWNQVDTGADDFIKNKPSITAPDDTAYGPTWYENADAPTKNAVYNKIQTMSASAGPTAWGKYF